MTESLIHRRKGNQNKGQDGFCSYVGAVVAHRVNHGVIKVLRHEGWEENVAGKG